MRSVSFFTAITLWLVLGCAAQAASFDCTKAQTSVEHLICKSPELSKLDDELAQRYKEAVQDTANAETIKRAQKAWLKERDDCMDMNCIRQSYQARGMVLGKTSATVNAVKCAAEDMLEQPRIRVEEIVGMYRQSVEGLPAYVYPSEERRHGYNYLAIEKLAGNRLRMRLSTKEINGHNCGFDSQALLCGKTIIFIPSEDESKALTISKQLQPRMRISAESIAFAEQTDGAVTHGAPYCGQMGYLRHKFLRTTKTNVIDEKVFLE